MPSARNKPHLRAYFNAIPANVLPVRLHIRCLRHYPLTADIANMRLMATVANASKLATQLAISGRTLALIMETSTILYIVLGILVFVLLIQKIRLDKNSEYDSYSNERNDWGILTSFSEFKILSKYAGEIPFGPAFIHIKTEPKNVFNNEFFSDWFYRTENGVFLQRWSLNPLKKANLPNAVRELIFIDFDTKKLKIMHSDLKTFWMDIEKNEKDELILVLNNIKSEEKIKITTANKDLS